MQRESSPAYAALSQAGRRVLQNIDEEVERSGGTASISRTASSGACRRRGRCAADRSGAVPREQAADTCTEAVLTSPTMSHSIL